MIYLGGYDPLKEEEFVTSDTAGGGGPIGRPDKDGPDSSGGSAILRVPIESIEMNFPFRVLEQVLREDTGGPGEYRGGLGWERTIEVMRGENISMTYRGERHYKCPTGILGGLAGTPSAAFIIRNTGKVEEIPSKRDTLLNAGDKLHILGGGNGGYGDPLKRKPEAVLRDVLDGRVSLSGAADDYGVVIDIESRSVDLKKSVELRKKQARARGPVTWIYDLGAPVVKK